MNLTLVDEHPIQFNTVQEFCNLLKTDPSELQWLCKNIQKHYRIRYKPKKNGKLREICNPNERLRTIQIVLNRYLRQFPLPDYMQTGLKGRSIKTNAEPHYNAPVLVTVDIQDFYPSISFPRVMAFLQKELSVPGEIALFFSRLITIENRVPQGAITSPTLVALIAYKNGRGVASDLHYLAERFKGQFTMYGDDACISGPIGSKDHLLKCAKELIERHGFKWHPTKSIQRIPGERKSTPGVDVTHGPDVPHEKWIQYKREFKALETKPDSAVSTKSMLGKVAYIKSLNPGAGRFYKKKITQLLNRDMSKSPISSQ